MIEEPDNAQENNTHGSIPVDAFPEPLRSFIAQTAKAIGCDPALVALPVLATVAASIGSTRNAMVRKGWYEPPIVWCMSIARSGSAKSPACDAATRPLEAIETAEVKAALDSGHVDSVPTRVVSDLTREALDIVLAENERGLLLIADEATSFIGGIDRYRSGRTSDEGRWLPLWQAQSVRRHRATGEARRVFVRNPHLSFCGCLTPGSMADFVRSKHGENGLVARMLVAMPDPKPALWSFHDPSDEVIGAYAERIEELANLRPDQRADGEFWPRSLRLDASARRTFIPYHDWSKRKATEATDNLSGMLSKLAGQTVRIAMLFELIVDLEAEVISVDSMHQAIALGRWFAEERRQIDIKLQRQSGESDDKLAAWINQWCWQNTRTGITASELHKNRKGTFPASADAEQALNDLALRGLGRWEHPPPGPGRKTRRFVPVGLPRNPKT